MPSQSTDVALLFALEEEFDQFYPEIASSSRADADEKTGRTFFLFDSAVEGAPAYRCVTTFIGTMGAQDAGFFAGTLIDRYLPRTVVLLGIAGSLSDDVLLGDVVVADQIDDYFQDAKYGKQGFTLAGRVYRADVRLTNIIRYFRFRYTSLWEEITRQNITDLRAILAANEIAELQSLIRADGSKAHVGHLASGPVVAAAEEYSQWLRNRDRKFLAIEMEAAGVMNAVYQRAGDQRVMVLRGISDLSDGRKTILDRIGHGAFRGLAMRSALRLLRALFTAGVLERSEAEKLPQSVKASSGAERSPEERVLDLTGRDPVVGNRAIDDISSRPQIYAPLLREVLVERAFDMQLAHRMPIAFGKLGQLGIDLLIDVLQSGKWWPMVRAAQCFRYIPKDSAADRVAEMVTTETNRMDVTRQAILALGYMGARGWCTRIREVALGDDEYAFEKLSFYAFRAFALMMVRSHDTPEAKDLMRHVEAVVRSSVGKERFGAGYEPEEEWRSVTRSLTPQAEEALLQWFDGDDPRLTTLATIAYSQSRNPRLLSRMIRALQLNPDSQNRSDIFSYLKAQDTDESFSVALRLLDDLRQPEPWSAWELMSCMMYRLGGRWKEVHEAIQSQRYPRLKAQALYTSGGRLETVEGAKNLLNVDDEIARGGGALALAISLRAKGREIIEPLCAYASGQVERALMLAAAVRCGIAGSEDALNTALTEIKDPIRHVDYVWRRELVYAVSRKGPSGRERGQAWGDLFGIDFRQAENEVGRFAVC